MKKRDIALAWVFTLLVAFLGFVEHQIWSGLGIVGGLWVHGIGLILIVSLWAFSVLCEGDNSHDGGW